MSTEPRILAHPPRGGIAGLKALLSHISLPVIPSETHVFPGNLPTAHHHAPGSSSSVLDASVPGAVSGRGASGTHLLAGRVHTLWQVLHSLMH